MNDMTPGLGHNLPPDPIGDICAIYESDRITAESWADGALVENEAQMNEADAIRKSMREWRLALEKGQKDATTPLRAAYQAELDRWKPYIEDAKRIEGCLVAAVGDFKKRIAAEKVEAERKARAEAEAKMRAAEEAARRANAADLEAQREAEAKMREAREAVHVAAEAKRDQVKGLRTVTKYEITDHRALLNWIARNRRSDITAFIEEWSRRNHKENTGADGLRVWQEKEAF